MRGTHVPVSSLSGHPGFWSSRTVLILALAGTTVGLGNVWRFPYLVGEHGGSAFILVYLVCIALVGLPLMVAELFIGRHGRRNPVSSLVAVSLGEGGSPAWGLIGVASVFAAWLLLSAYSVVGGWSMAYVFRAAAGSLQGLDAAGATATFRYLAGDAERMLAWHTLFIAVTAMIVSRGLRQGFEEAARWFVPLLIGILVLLVFVASGRDGLPQAVAFLTRPDFARLGVDGVLAALGHAFFSLTLGVGAVMAFGRYADARVPLVPTACAVVLLDTAVALLAGFAVFPFVFEAGLSPTSGPPLVFQTLPLAMDAAPGGRYLAILFFAMLCLAAWTSAIAMMEPLVTLFSERLRVDRPLATSLAALAVWLLGLASVLSFNEWSHLALPANWPGLGGLNIFDAVNYLAINLLLPLAGLGLALFVGWRVSDRTLFHGVGDGVGFRIWLFLLRFATPVAMVLVFLQATGRIGGLVDWFQ